MSDQGGARGMRESDGAAPVQQREEPRWNRQAKVVGLLLTLVGT